MSASIGTTPKAGEAALRSISHQGKPNSERFHFKRTNFRHVQTVLSAGDSIGARIAALMGLEGCSSGIIKLKGGRLNPFDFVIPADDPLKKHAVWYSSTRSIGDGAAIERASCSVGLREGESHLHCHGLWRNTLGELVGGHLLPDDNMIIEPVMVDAVLSTDAWFERKFDPETNFELFATAGGGSGTGVIATVRPNTDITDAIARIAQAAGITSASIHGVGSLIDMALLDGRVAESLALEVAITGGRVIPHHGGVQVEGLTMAGVGMDGVPFEGALVSGRNRVCVTFELALYAEYS